MEYYLPERSAGILPYRSQIIPCDPNYLTGIGYSYQTLPDFNTQNYQEYVQPTQPTVVDFQPSTQFYGDLSSGSQQFSTQYPLYGLSSIPCNSSSIVPYGFNNLTYGGGLASAAPYEVAGTSLSYSAGMHMPMARSRSLVRTNRNMSYVMPSYRSRSLVRLEDEPEVKSNFRYIRKEDQVPYVTTTRHIRRFKSANSLSSSFLGFAIFVCLCCFFPVGIFAVCFACQSRRARSRGYLEKAERKSRLACLTSSIGLAMGIATIVCSVVLVWYYFFGPGIR